MSALDVTPSAGAAPSSAPPEPAQPLTLDECTAILTRLARVPGGPRPAGCGGGRLRSREGADAGAERLQAVEARFRALVEQLPAVTFMAALDGGLNELYVSPQIEALLGYTQQEWLRDPVLWFRRLHPDDRELLQARLPRRAPGPHPRALRGGARRVRHRRARRRDGLPGRSRPGDLGLESRRTSMVASPGSSSSRTRASWPSTSRTR